MGNIAAKSAMGETLTATKVDSVNSFDRPDTVLPKSIAAKVRSNKLQLEVEPKSVIVISLDE